MKLTRIDTGAVEDVAVPAPLSITQAVGSALKMLRVSPGDVDWNSVLQSWAYRNGYEVPETNDNVEVLSKDNTPAEPPRTLNIDVQDSAIHPRLRSMLEATTNVKRHTKHSKKTGKSWVTRSHDRKTIDGALDAHDAAYDKWEKEVAKQTKKVGMDKAYDTPSVVQARAELDVSFRALDKLGITYYGDRDDVIIKGEKPVVKDKALDRWNKKLTSAEKSGLESYAESHFDIQDALRGNELSSRVKSIVRNVDSAINKFKFDKDTVLYRGVNFEQADAFMQQIKPGSTLVDKAYLSTSKSLKVGTEFSKGLPDSGMYGKHRYLFKIRVPKGTKAAPLGVLDEYKNKEEEFLLARNTKLKVKKVTKKGKTIYVDAAVTEAVALNERLLAEVRVKSHTRRSKKGKASRIPQYERRAPKSSSDYVKMFGAIGHDVQDAVYDFQHEDLGHQLSAIQQSAAGTGDDKRIKLLDLYVSKAPKTKQDVVYRGLRSGSIESLTPKTFTSASTTKTHAEGFAKDGALLVIHGARGVAARMSTGYDTATREGEVLFPRGTRFQLVKTVGKVTHVRVLRKLKESFRLQERTTWVRGYDRYTDHGHEYVHPHPRQIVEVDSIEKTKRQFLGKEINTKLRYSKTMLGKLGEALTMKSLGGMAVNEYLGIKKNNLPYDVINVRKGILYEVKAGAISNKKSDRKWRLTKGEPSDVEKKWLKRAPEDLKRLYNTDKEGMILARKKIMKREIEKMTGKKFKVRTIAYVVNPDTQSADQYVIDGLHPVIRWHWPVATKNYKRSLKWK